MNSVAAFGLCSRLMRTVTAAVFLGAALIGATASVNAAPTGTDLAAMTKDPGCEVFGWRHPQCAGGAWDDDESASQEWGPADVPNPVSPDIGGPIVFPGSPATPA